MEAWNVLLFVIALTLNPHPDLWLGDTDFAAKYCPTQLDALKADLAMMAEVQGRVAAAVGAVQRETVWIWLRDVERSTTQRTETLAREVARWREFLRAHPTYRRLSPQLDWSGDRP